MLMVLLAVIYLSFISLGLPDSLLGAAWPSMYQDLGVQVSSAGMISMIIALGTIISSLQSDRLTRKFGTGAITACSVAMTAAALFGFSCSHSFLMLCLWAVPYGLGAGSVDASLNNYVALHYASRHMSWLHCMWGIGASAGPYLMGYALTAGMGWNAGYRIIGILQVILTAVLLVSLPLWGKVPDRFQKTGNAAAAGKPLPLRKVIAIPGAAQVMAAFFCYCALEQTTGLWGSSYLVFSRGISAEQAAGYASLFFVGITGGRLISGFLSMLFSDEKMVRLGQALTAAGIFLLFLPAGELAALFALVLIGFGCAPVYPSLIHATPDSFGADRSQAVIGVQMASAYIGTCLMPPLFGLLARAFGTALLPFYLGILLLLMILAHEKMLRIVKNRREMDRKHEEKQIEIR